MMSIRNRVLLAQLLGIGMTVGVALAALVQTGAPALWFGALCAAGLVSLLLAFWLGARSERPLILLQQQLQHGEVAAPPAGGVWGEVFQRARDLQAELRTLAMQARDSAQAAAEAAHALAGMTEQVSSSVQQQADSTREAAATIQQMTVSINHVTNSSGKASRMAREAGEVASQRVQDVMASSEHRSVSRR
jgi:methyl-accepting chemotaxis protein